jgi:spermidine/putrescine-binding protein
VTELDSAGFKAKFVIPDEGQLMWVAGYGISKDCQNLPAAYALINYYLSPTAQAWQASNYFYMVSNRKTLEAVTPAVRKKAMLDAPARFTNSVVTPLPDNYNEWVMVWSEIKQSL